MPLFPHNQFEVLHAPGRALFVVNPGAGTGQSDQIREIVKRLAGNNAPHKVVGTERRGHATQLARDAVAEGGWDRIVAVGGDGTAMEVITGTIGSGMPVVHVPAGTANVIAMELAMPGDLNEACALALSEAGVVPFDLGWSGGKYFAARLGIGLEAETVRGAGHGAKRRWGRLGYVYHAVLAWRDRRLTPYAVAVDNTIFTRRAHTVILTNVANVGIPGINISSTASPADGKLDLCILRTDSAAELLRAVNSILNDNTLAKGEWEVIPVSHAVEVRARPRQRVQVDGEPAGVTPTMAAVLPRMVRMVVPIAAQEDGLARSRENGGAKGTTLNGNGSRHEHRSPTVALPSESAPEVPHVGRPI